MGRGRDVCLHGRAAVLDQGGVELYRSWGVDVIGMTNLQEAKLAREAEICYATVAMVTDYDCWHPEHDSVTVDQIVKVLNRIRRMRATWCAKQWRRCRGARMQVRIGAEVCDPDG